MRRFLMALMGIVMSMGIAFAQADKIVGTYKAVQNGETSKVRIYKHGQGYRAQVVWLEQMKTKDGTLKKDYKNPDKAKRNTPANKIVLIDQVTYDDSKKEWRDGKIYDPTKGKSFKVVLSFKDAKTLQVKGSLGPFSQTVYWTKE